MLFTTSIYISRIYLAFSDSVSASTVICVWFTLLCSAVFVWFYTLHIHVLALLILLLCHMTIRHIAVQSDFRACGFLVIVYVELLPFCIAIFLTHIIQPCSVILGVAWWPPSPGGLLILLWPSDINSRGHHIPEKLKRVLSYSLDWLGSYDRA